MQIQRSGLGGVNPFYYTEALDTPYGVKMRCKDAVVLSAAQQYRHSAGWSLLVSVLNDMTKKVK